MKLVDSAFFVVRGTNQVLSYETLKAFLTTAYPDPLLLSTVSSSELGYSCGDLMAQGQVVSKFPICLDEGALDRANLSVVLCKFPAYPQDALLASGDLVTPISIALQGSLNESLSRNLRSEQGLCPALSNFRVTVGAEQHSSLTELCLRTRNVVFGEAVEEILPDMFVWSPGAPVATPIPLRAQGHAPVPPAPTLDSAGVPVPPWGSPPPAAKPPATAEASPDAQHEKAMQTIKSMFSMF